MRPLARDVLRRWLRQSGSDAFNQVGQDAIRAAADATARLSRFEDAESAQQILIEVETTAAALFAPSASHRRWWSPRRREAASLPGPAAIAALVERLDRQRDAVTRRLIVLRTDRARLNGSDRALEDAIHVIRALPAAVEAAAREIRGQDFFRATVLLDQAATTLPEREQAVLTQWAINRQAMLTLDLLIANQTTLGEALAQARTATLSALQVAMVAQRATRESEAITRQAEALARTADTAVIDRGGSAQVRRMLDDAVAQARAALATMPTASDR